MSEFREFKLAVQQKFNEMVTMSDVLFLTDVEKDKLWETYVEGFPEGSNNIYKEKREHDCNSCRQFIRPFGNVVAIRDNELISIWDVIVSHPFDVVAKKLSTLVKSKAIKDVFISKLAQLGIDKNHQQLEDGSILTWEHFSFKLPVRFVDKSSDSIEAKQGQLRDSRNVFARSLNEISIDAIESTLELIAQNSLYRGEESKGILETFLRYKKEYISTPHDRKIRDNYCWDNFTKAGPAISKIRNSAIGTLLTDISEGKELDAAVTAFERIMAPSNYKRPTAILTSKMIEQAQEKIEELGLADSLGRRYAIIDDITINNVIFANRDSKKKMNASVFDSLKEDVPVNPKSFGKVEEVSIDDFVNNVIPKATNIELMMENSHSGNLMSLIAPTDEKAPSILKWNNNFCWSYNGEVADSIKEAVKARGGNVTGVLRFSVMWGENQITDNSDLDAHCIEPDGHHIYYASKRNPLTTGALDVDITHPNSTHNKDVVENITWEIKSKMKKGAYTFYVNNYALRGEQKGFIAEIEFDGQIHQFVYNQKVKDKESIPVAKVNFDGTNFKLTEAMPSSVATQLLWDVKTNNFQKVSMMMFSPNHWDEQGIGNKHYFFILEGCKNPGTPRGFYNEFLNEDLMGQKRVFEALGDKMKVEPSDEQLSGLGFSSTQRNSVIARVEGSTKRTIKINF